jgi:3-oxoacyl-[acyl-carrier protein] reductase
VLGPQSAFLDGKVAVVTGAAVGIGTAVAVALARFGAEVAVCDRDGEQLASTVSALEECGRTAVWAVLDVRDDPAVSTFVDEVGSRFGRIDIVVNNAGGGFHSPFIDISRGGQDALVAENFTSVTSVIRAALPHMSRGGSIVNITSIEAHRAAPGYAVYSAMKAGVANLTKTLALELGAAGIRVNCVAPDVIATPGIGELAGEPRTPLLRRGHVDDVAGAVVFLAGELSAFVTGTTVHVDGGNLAAGGWHRDDDGTFST